jgi:hypothetical protein
MSVSIRQLPITNDLPSTRNCWMVTYRNYKINPGEIVGIWSNCTINHWNLTGKYGWAVGYSLGHVAMGFNRKFHHDVLTSPVDKCVLLLLLCCLVRSLFCLVAVLELSQVSIESIIYIYMYICVCIIYNHTFEYMAIQIISPFPRFTSYFSMSFFGRKKNIKSLVATGAPDRCRSGRETPPQWCHGIPWYFTKRYPLGKHDAKKNNVRGCAGIHKDFWTFRMFFYVFLCFSCENGALNTRKLPNFDG